MKMILVIIIFLLGGCGLWAKDNSEESAIGKTGLAIIIPEPVGNEVFGFLINVYGPGVIECDPMPTEPLASREPVDMEERNLPVGSSVPSLGHRFADKFLVLEAGSYCLEAIPVDSFGVRVDACSIAKGGPYSVVSSQSNEVILVSNCGMPDNGVIGSVVVVNNKPLITEILLDRGRFISTCETLRIIATAIDPDGDALTYEWQVIERPAGDAHYEAIPTGNTLTFRSFIPGSYRFTVRACDTFQICTFLSFSISVSGIDCFPSSTHDGGT